MKKDNRHISEIFPACNRIVPPEVWRKLTDELPDNFDPAAFPDFLLGRLKVYNLPAWLPDLTGIEFNLFRVGRSRKDSIDLRPAEPGINPSLSLLKVGWRRLPSLLHRRTHPQAEPEPGEEYILVWMEPRSGKVQARAATTQELLALKIVAEKLDKKELVRQQRTTLAILDSAIEKAAAAGLLIRPPSLLTRKTLQPAGHSAVPEKFLTARVFTLQCHITQSCDLRCRHCYDRSNRTTLGVDDAVRVFDQMYDFCRSRHVYGQVSFSGGNPLLHPRFFDIYRAAADYGFMTAILGNPTTPEMLAGINAVRKPEFFQVSLEGLREHNDYIRGAGFFDRVLQFLQYLRQAQIYSMVMLTLTRENMDQVLPLAELLRDKVDLFTFNRLSMVGEGAQLQTPAREEYEAFLRRYLDARRHNPIMGLKDSLINIVRDREGEELFGGCAGFGCGAAFNFVALLPDGEVHACRKFNSPIGNIHQQHFAEIYASQVADLYRRGPSSCGGCRIRHVCGGCLAVIDSRGLDITTDCDPCCFMERP